MDFKLLPASSRIRKDFESAVKVMSEEEKTVLFNLLIKNPLKGNKRGQYYSYNISKSDRLLYEVNQKEGYVLIVLVGDHKKYERFLNRFKR